MKKIIAKIKNWFVQEFPYPDCCWDCNDQSCDGCQEIPLYGVENER